MNSNEYLKQVLEQQIFNNDDQELVSLREQRAEINQKLRGYFWKSNPSIKWAGSMAKGTMIRECYDGDMTCYFSCDEKEAGETLEKLHEAVRKSLENDYSIEIKASALRIRAKNNWSSDLHIDVVPGRYFDESKSDVFLHRTIGDKQRLKTNLQTHIDYIKDSEVRDAIRLIKLWKARNGIISAKTFILELLVIKLLEKSKSFDISSQLSHIWTKFRDELNSLSVEDPANSNNDLKPALEQCRSFLSSVANTTLWQIENNSWTSVFGQIQDKSKSEMKGNVNEEIRSVALKFAVASVATPTRPWCQEH
jgi:Second Messenger Oligonucleotide or Dinucleotide Synthetase domain